MQLCIYARAYVATVAGLSAIYACIVDSELVHVTVQIIAATRYLYSRVPGIPGTWPK